MGILIGMESVSHEWPGKRVLVDQTIAVNEGDLTIDVWKDALVMEDANYILDSFEVEDFILQHCQS